MNGGPTLVQVKNSPFRDRSLRRTSDPLSQAKVDILRSNESSFHGTPRSVKNRKTTRYRDEARSKTFSEFDTSGIIVDDSANAKGHVARVSEDEENEEPPPHTDPDASNSWTVRLRTAKNTGAIVDSKSISSSLQSSRTAPEVVAEQNRTAADGSDHKNSRETNSSTLKSKLPVANGRMTSSEIILKSDQKVQEENRDCQKVSFFWKIQSGKVLMGDLFQEANAALMHTLRKGWLMLKGRSDNDWTKHWVVLAGLSLKMYK